MRQFESQDCCFIHGICYGCPYSSAGAALLWLMDVSFPSPPELPIRFIFLVRPWSLQVRATPPAWEPPLHSQSLIPHKLGPCVLRSVVQSVQQRRSGLGGLRCMVTQQPPHAHMNIQWHCPKGSCFIHRRANRNRAKIQTISISVVKVQT